MRLTCPNCGAQYEVPDEVIPEEGRDVQCSNCGNTWYQAHPDHPEAAREADYEPGATDDWEEETDDLGVDGDTEADDLRRDAHADEGQASVAAAGVVPDILREEAEREARLRAEEAGGLESQPDLGLESHPADEADRRAREARDRMARIRGEQPPTAVATDNGSRRGLLPDIEEINSTLRSSGSAGTGTELGPLREPEPEVEKKEKSSFMRGFALAVLLGVLLTLVYTRSREISELVPQADPVLNTYVSAVDQARAWLDEQANALVRQTLPD